MSEATARALDNLPDPLQTRVLLIGSSEFSELDDLPAVRGNLIALRDLFRDIWNLPPDHCTVVADPALPRDVSRAVRRAVDEATDTLLIYYAGHGLIEPRTGQLHLAIEGSDPKFAYDSAVPYEWIRREVEGSAATRRIVVLDCCYSARAFGVQSASAELAVDGTYLLAAAAETAVALSPPGEPLTTFTGEWVTVLQQGVPSGPEYLSLDAIFARLRTRLVTRDRPEPQRLCRNQLGQAAFVRNPAYKPVAGTPRALGRGGDGSSVPQPLVTDLATADLYTARTLADTLQAVVDGIVSGFGYELAAINLVRPDGDLVVAAVAGSTSAEALMAGRVGSRAAWEQRLTVGEDQDGLRFIPHSEGRILDEDGVPELFAESSEPYDEGRWNPGDRLYAPMFTIRKELLGVLSVDRPRNGHRPGPEGRNALTAYAFHASIAISNARLRANMQRALVRLEREQQALRASEESFRQAFEYAPSGAAIAEMGGDQHGRIVRANDALCRLLERPAVALRRLSLVDLVHPEDIGTMLNTEAEGGRSEVRLARRDGKYLWVSLRTSVVAEPDDGPKYLLTHVTDIEERKIHEKDATYDALTGLLSEAGLRRHLAGQLCGVVPEGKGSADAMMASASSMSVSRSHRHKGEPGGALPGLAVLHYGLDGFKAINTRFGHEAGDKVLAEIAHRLLDAASSYNCEIEIARIRGDEFIVLMNDPDSSRVPHKAADQMRGACHRRISLGGKNGTVQLDAKFVVHWASCGSSANQVLQRSATLLYEKKRQSSKFRGG